MTKQEFFSVYKPVIIGSVVEGFRIVGQFPILELRNDRIENQIEFHVDCRISSNNEELNKFVNELSTYDKDVYEVAYFIGVNRMEVKTMIVTKDDNLSLLFSNDIELTFKLNDDWSEPLNISVMKDKKYLRGCRFMNDGTIQ